MACDHNEDIIELLTFTRDIVSRFGSAFVLNTFKKLGWMETTIYNHPVDYIMAALNEEVYADSVSDQIEMFYNDLYEVLADVRENTTQCGVMDNNGTISWSTKAANYSYANGALSIDLAAKRPF